jgi:hypothetical protein
MNSRCWVEILIAKEKIRSQIQTSLKFNFKETIGGQG